MPQDSGYFGQPSNETGDAYLERSTLQEVVEIRAFMERKLPPAMRKQADHLTAAVVQAAARYNRYAARKDDWKRYVERKRRLNFIGRQAGELAAALSALDSLSRDDLATRFMPSELMSLTGSLNVLRQEASSLATQVQRSGRPQDLADDRWVSELADIYETNFGQPARIFGSGDDSAKWRGGFYDLLQVGCPSSRPQHGTLSPRQIHRVLKRRRASSGPEFAFL